MRMRAFARLGGRAPNPLPHCREACSMTPLAAWHSMASSHPALPSAFLGGVLSDRTIDDLFMARVPVQFFAAPVGLGRHDAHEGMREAMIDSGVRVCARLHRLKPIHQIGRASCRERVKISVVA